jgi:TonB family protein
MAQQVHLPPPPMQRSSFRLAPVLMIAALVAVGAAVFHFTRQAPQTSRGSEIAAAPVVDAPMDNNNGYAVATPLDPQMSSSAGVQPQAPRRAQATPPAQPRPRAAPSKQETAAYVPPVITFSAPAEQAPPAQQPAAAAPPAPTPAPQAAASPYISPVWTRRPTSTALVSAYPSQAADRGVSGQVTLDCGIFGTGALACTVASESPSKMGFGRAALAVANGFRAAPTTASGEPTAGKRVRVPISFKAQE